MSGISSATAQRVGSPPKSERYRKERVRESGGLRDFSLSLLIHAVLFAIFFGRFYWNNPAEQASPKTVFMEVTHPLGEAVAPSHPVARPRPKSRLQEAKTASQRDSVGPTDEAANPSEGLTAGKGESSDSGEGVLGGPLVPVFQVVRKPSVIKEVRAEYPRDAALKGLQSEVVLKLLISAHGTVVFTEVLKSGGSEFDRAAVDALREFKFSPARLSGGEKVAVEIVYTYSFKLH